MQGDSRAGQHERVCRIVVRRGRRGPSVRLRRPLLGSCRLRGLGNAFRLFRRTWRTSPAGLGVPGSGVFPAVLAPNGGWRPVCRASLGRSRFCPAYRYLCNLGESNLPLRAVAERAGRACLGLAACGVCYPSFLVGRKMDLGLWTAPALVAGAVVSATVVSAIGIG